MKSVRRPSRAAAPWMVVAAVTALVGVLGADVFRCGFFADDFHFLDVARRVPLLRALSGQFGVYPWYRPLSRELYFALVVAAGPLGLVTAHALSLAVAGLCAWQIRALAMRLAGPRVAAIAPALFLTYAVTKFLAAWASGFQDLLALLLVLLAVRTQIEGRTRQALVWAFLAPFAKETAVLVFPLLASQTLLFARGREARSALLAQAGVLAAVAALHLAVRATWHTGGIQSRIERSLPALVAALSRVAGGFVGGPPVLEPGPIALAATAAVAATVLVRSAAGGSAASATNVPRGNAAPGGSRAELMFLALASAMGLAPLVVGHTVGLVSPYDYYAFTAAPWLALLLAWLIALLPPPGAASVTVALVAWNTLALGFRTPDLSSPEAWRFRNWDWPEAVRLSAVSRRLAADVRSELASRPESLVVLYRDLRWGSFFQTEDGPATRESLGDPTVRAYWLNAPPYGLSADRLRMLSFDADRRHLRLYRMSHAERGGLTATAVAIGNAPAAWAFASYGDSADNARFDLTYFRVAAVLMAEGVAGARRELEANGLADTTGTNPERVADDVVGRGSALYAPMVGMLQRPLTAGSHVALADGFHGIGAAVSEAVELRIAVALDPTRSAVRDRLAATVSALGQEPAARRDLARLGSGAATPEAAPTRGR